MPPPLGDPRPAPGPHAAERLRERAVEVLLGDSLSAAVALVCWAEGPEVHVADRAGHVALRPDGQARLLGGRDPLGAADPLSDDPDCYPFAVTRLRSLFSDPRAPDLAVVHTGGHYWPERGGHLGEHGSLNAAQSRAPLLLSGAGVSARGVVPEVARVVDVGATLARLCGAAYDDMDGRPLELAGPGARHVVGLLWDGAPSSEVLELAAAGELPTVGRLLERGCALAGGAIAEFPSVTLVNHTSALTGVRPGRHGIVNNAFFDRALGRRVEPNSSDGWHEAMRWLRPGVRTVFQRLPEGVSSACVNEPVDTGADYSTFALLRAQGGGTGLSQLLPAADTFATPEHQGDPDYEWGSRVDTAGLQQVLDLWRDGPPPALTWWNTTVTDAGHHAGGPGSPVARASLRDSDRRLGAWLDLVAQRGLLEDTAVVLTADHGSQAADPSCRGDWDEALRAAGIPFRDESYGFIYLGV